MSNDIFVPSPDSVLGQLRLERPLGGAGSSVWRAFDTKSRREVAVRFLSRNLPRDRERRDALVARVRQSAALRHLGVIPILEIAVVDEVLLLVMPLLEGTTLRERIAASLPDKQEFLRLAWQLADAVGYLHSRNLVHGNLNDANVMITPAGDLKVGGIGLPCLADRRERQVFSQPVTSDELLDAAYRPPEQVTERPVTSSSDIYSIGAILYQMATGRPPFAGAEMTTLINSIVKGSMTSPHELNPQLFPAATGLIGRCLFKETTARYASAALLLEEIKKLDPSIVTRASHRVETAVQKSVGEGRLSHGVLVIGELPYHDLLKRSAPDTALQLEASMQQILGEAICLEDGEIVDSVGSRLVAIVPDGPRAIRALQAARAEFRSMSPLETHALEPRVIAHRGEMRRNAAGGVEGFALELSSSVLAGAEPLQFLLSETVTQEVTDQNFLQVGESGGVRWFALPELPERTVAPEPEMVAEAEVTKGTGFAPRPGRNAVMAIAAVLLVAVLAAGYMLFGRGAASAPDRISSTAPAPFNSLSMTDFALAGRTDEERVQLKSLERAVRLILGEPDSAVKVVPSSTGKLSLIRNGENVSGELQTAAGKTSVTIDPGAPGAMLMSVLELIRGRGNNSTAGPLTNQEAASEFVRFAGLSESPEARDEALAALESSLRSDPQFVAAARARAGLLEDGGGPRYLDACARLATLDSREIRCRLALFDQQSGEGKADAFRFLGEVIAADPQNQDAQVRVAREALRALDSGQFVRALAALRTPSREITIHSPDILAVGGRLDAAAERYYPLLEKQRENPHLQFKIGRLAILERSEGVAEVSRVEVEKSGSPAQRQFLSAYSAADRRDAAKARQFLGEALKSAEVGGLDAYVMAAEVHALLNDDTAVFASIDRALDRREVSASHLELNPLFAHLRSDSRFILLRNRGKQQAAYAREGLMMLSRK